MGAEHASVGFYPSEGLPLSALLRQLARTGLCISVGVPQLFSTACYTTYILAAPDASGFSGVGVERATVGFTPQRTASAPSTSGVCISVGAPRFSRRLAVPQTIHSTPDASGLSGVGVERATVGFTPQRTASAPSNTGVCVSAWLRPAFFDRLLYLKQYIPRPMPPASGAWLLSVRL